MSTIYARGALAVTPIVAALRTGTVLRAVAALPVITALSLLAAGCVASVPGPAAAAGPGAAGIARQLHRLFPGFRLRYGGTARLTATAPPASAALPGANDLLTAGHAVLAAADSGIWRSVDGGTSWRPVLAGIRAWSLTAVLSGGFAAIGNRPARNGLGPAVLATSPDGVHWRLLRVRAPGSLVPPVGFQNVAWLTDLWVYRR